VEILLGWIGLAENDDFALFVRWMVAEHQLRILRFLFDYCELDGALWEVTLNRAEVPVRRAAHAELRAFAA